MTISAKPSTVPFGNADMLPLGDACIILHQEYAITLK
jgi:hypothetical protein